MPKVRVEVEGLDKLRAALRSDPPIYAEAWRKAMQEATDLVVAEARHRAPAGETGNLKSGVRGRLKPGIMAEGIVTNDATAKSGGRYAFILNAGHRTYKVQQETWYERKRKGVATGKFSVRRKLKKVAGTEFVWRSGSRKGKRTHYWFYGALFEKRPEIVALLDKVAQGIERLWSQR